MTFMCYLTAALALLAANPVIHQQTQDADEIRRLVEQLGDESFAVRQAAMKQLWRDGNLSAETLRRFATVADAEVASRIQRILEHMELGISPDMPPEIAQRVFSFHHASDETRYAILYQLRDQGHHRWVMDLVMSIQDDYERDYVARNVYEDGEDVVRRILKHGDLSETDLAQLDQLMDHRYMWETHPGDCVVYAELSGTLDAKIEALRQLVRDDAADDAARMRLVWLLRGSGQLDDALAVASQLQPPRPRVLHQLRVELTDWSGLAEQLPEDPEMSVWAKTAMPVLLHFWSGNQSAQRESQRRLDQSLADGLFADHPRGALANLRLAILDTDWLLAHADEMDRGFAFQLLCYMLHFDRAFALTGAPADAPGRKEWFRDQVRQLSRHIRLYEERNSITDAQRAEELFALCRHFAFYVGTLGEPADAIELFEILAEGIQIDHDEYFRSWNLLLFANLARLDIGDHIWHFFDLLQIDSEITEASRELFADSPEAAIVWYGILKDLLPDSRDRLRLIASLLKSPFADHDTQLDLDRLMTIGREQLDKNLASRRPRLLMRMAQTLEINGRSDLAQDLYMESGYLGDDAAFRRLGNQAAAGGDWKQAVTWYDQCYQVSQHSTDLYLVSVAQNQVADAAAEKNRLRARLAELHSYDLVRLAQQVHTIGAPVEARALMSAYLRGNDFDSESNFFDYQRMAAIVAEQDPVAAAQHWRTATLLRFQYLDVHAPPSLTYHYLAMQGQLAQARDLMQRGETSAAFELLMQCAKFMGSDTAVAEEFVPWLQSSGHADQANQLFEYVADRYRRVLDKYPNSALHNNNFAWACARCDRHLNDALQHAERAVALQPDNTSYLDTLAELQFRLGNVAKAVELAKRCIDLNPFKSHYREQLTRFERGTDTP